MGSLTAEKAIEILNEINDILNTPENMQKLEEMRKNYGNEMLKMMQTVFPFTIQIEMDVIKNHGYVDGREGILQFTKDLRDLERDYPEIEQLNQKIRKLYLPVVNVNSVSQSKSTSSDHGTKASASGS